MYKKGHKKPHFDEFLRLFARGFAPGLVQRSGVRGQRSEVRGQRSEIRGQRSEVRDQRSEVRDQGSGEQGDKGPVLGWAGIDSEFQDPGADNR